MKTKICVVLIIILFLSGLCLAVPDNVTIGSYRISFDIGLDKGNYQAIFVPPINMETKYGKKIAFLVQLANVTQGKANPAEGYVNIEIDHFEDAVLVPTVFDLLKSMTDTPDVYLWRKGNKL